MLPPSGVVLSPERADPLQTLSRHSIKQHNNPKIATDPGMATKAEIIIKKR